MDLQTALDPIVAPDRGGVADDIAECTAVDPGVFGIAVVLADGCCLTAGDADVGVSVQSIFKVTTLAIAQGIS